MTNNFELAVYSRDELFKDRDWLFANNTNIRKENVSTAPKAAAKKGGE